MSGDQVTSRPGLTPGHSQTLSNNQQLSKQGSLALALEPRIYLQMFSAYCSLIPSLQKIIIKCLINDLYYCF